MHSTSSPSPSSPDEDSDVPECPVCLQPYDATTVVPRVLPCGHSICHVCIPLLPPSLPSHPNSLRCPSCTQLVPFDRQVGPASLPKNLDLLHFIPSAGEKERIVKGNEVSKHNFDKVEVFMPLNWRKQSQFSDIWKNYLLPEKLVILEGNEEEIITSVFFVESKGSPWFCEERESFRVFELRVFEGFGEQEKSGWFKLSYVYRAMDVIEKLGDKAQNELQFFLEATSNIKNGICKIYGIWMNLKEDQTSNLYLVSEKFDHKFDFSSKLWVDKDEDSIFQIGLICMELCEIITNLHLKGISLGCFGFDCFFFDKFGHIILDLNRVLALCRILKEVSVKDDFNFTSLSDIDGLLLLSPELLQILQKGPLIKDLNGYSSDVWCLACLIITFLTGNNKIISELISNLNSSKDFVEFYEDWKQKIMDKLKGKLTNTKFESLIKIIESCLSYNSKNRPQAVDLFEKFKEIIFKKLGADVAQYDSLRAKEEGFSCCLLLANFYSIDLEINVERNLNLNISGTGDFLKETGTSGFKTGTLIGHRDCVSALAVEGDFVFSSSYDKTINVWSLRDFSLVQTLRGHEHRIMAILVIKFSNQPFLVTADAGSGILIWKINNNNNNDDDNNNNNNNNNNNSWEFYKKWYEHNDWLYSGVHSLAFCETGYLYSGSADKSIKAWNFMDESLISTMTGHKSTVSCLAVQNGILYSGSWDGTIRLWWISDHTNLCILNENNVNNNISNSLNNGNLVGPVLSLCLGPDFVASAYETGYFKIWRNEMLVRSEKLTTGAIYALYLYKNLIFTGGSDKTVNIQEIVKSEAELEIRDVATIKCEAIITSLLYSQGKLFVGLANKEIKVYQMES